jgi:MOSC domain-containing protein YiiM
MASVVSLFVSPGIGQPMQPRTSVQALVGRGLEGDRYASGQGSYSKLPRLAARHVSLIGREAMEASNEELSRRGLTPFEPKETRRNIVVEGIDVYALLGHEFRIGAVRLRGSEPTLPCRIPSAVAGKTGFAEAYHGRGGIRAEVLSNGIISIGDLIQTDLLAGK